MASADTKARILDAAERLIAARGYHAVSMRSIAEAADVPLASVSYHFGTKEGLYSAIFERRMGPLYEKRDHALDALMRAAAPGLPTLEEVLTTFMTPVIEVSRDPGRGGEDFGRLMAEILNAPEDERVLTTVRTHFDVIAVKMLKVLGAVLPTYPEADLVWAYQFMAGSMLHIMANTGRLERLSRGKCSAKDVDAIMKRLVPWVAAGIRSLDPALQKQRRRRTPKAAAEAAATASG